MNKDYESIKNSKFIKKLKDKGITLVVLDSNNFLINFKLEGEIKWTNFDGTTTVLEERGSVSDLESFNNLCRHYLNNAEKYTNFV